VGDVGQPTMTRSLETNILTYDDVTIERCECGGTTTRTKQWSVQPSHWPRRRQQRQRCERIASARATIANR